jgi:hypothetical protein
MDFFGGFSMHTCGCQRRAEMALIRQLVSSATISAKAGIRYSEMVGAASVSVTIPIIILDQCCLLI